MRILVMVLVMVFLIVGISRAELENYYVSGASVSFNTSVTIVTFNTVVNSLYIRNESTTDSLFVFYKKGDIGWNADKTYYTNPAINYCAGTPVASGDAVRLIPTSANRWSDITLKEKTDIFAFAWQTGAAAVRGVTYIAEDDVKRP